MLLLNFVKSLSWLLFLVIVNLSVVHAYKYRDCWLLFGGVDDVGWTHASNIGRLQIHHYMRDRYPDDEFETIGYPGTFFMSTDDRAKLINQTIADGCNFILAGSDSILNNLHQEYAREFPNVTFGRLTAFPNIDADRPTNLVEFGGDWFNMSFVAGAVAASTSKTCAGFINALESAKSAWGHAMGFAMGYHWMKPDQHVHIVTMDSYYNPDSEVLAAKQIIEQKGCDVLGRHTDPNDVDKYVFGLNNNNNNDKDNQVLSIARYIDMSTFVGDTVFTSQVVDFFDYVQPALEASFLSARATGSGSGGGAIMKFGDKVSKEYTKEFLTSVPFPVPEFEMKLSPFTAVVDEDLAAATEMAARAYLEKTNPLCGPLRWRNGEEGEVLTFSRGSCLTDLADRTNIVSYLDLPNTTYYDSFLDGGSLCGHGGEYYSYSSNFSMTCHPCPENTFHFPDTRASTTCIPCANGTIAPTGSSQCTIPSTTTITIRNVSLGVEILSYILIAIAATINFALLFAVYYYRKESVLELSQGIFLGVFQIAALASTIFVFLYIPKYDIFCKMQSPLVLIPLQLLLAILYGRLKRIVALMLPLMQFHAYQPEEKGFLTSLLERVGLKKPTIQRRKRMSAKLRVQFSNARLCAYITIIMLPQVIIQIVGAIWFPQSLLIEMNEEDTIGRYQCGDSSTQQYYLLGSLACLFITLLFILQESQKSQMLPALFNEAKAISEAMVATILLSALGIIIIIITNSPESSPDIRYIIFVIVIICIVLNLSLRLILPKLRLIWKGEKVCISSLLREHKQKSIIQRSSCYGDSFISGRIGSNVSSDDEGYSTNKNSNTNSKNDIESVVSASKTCGNDDDTVNEQQDTKAEESDHDSSGTEKRSADYNFDDPETQQEQQKNIEAGKIAFIAGERRKLRRREHTTQGNIVISKGKAPPSVITKCIIEHTDIMNHVHKRLLSGLEVPQEEWEDLQLSFEKMNQTFNEKTKYEWE